MKNLKVQLHFEPFQNWSISAVNRCAASYHDPQTEHFNIAAIACFLVRGLQQSKGLRGESRGRTIILAE